MANLKTKFKSKKQDWETPKSLFDKLNSIYDFTFDLASDANNTKCINFFSKDDNALSKSWNGRCWLNPPYGGSGKNRLSLWVKKAYEESFSDNCMVVMLIPARTNTIWWHELCMNANEILFIKGRPKFVGATYGLPQPLAIVVFNKSDDSDLKIGSVDS